MEEKLTPKIQIRKKLVTTVQKLSKPNPKFIHAPIIFERKIFINQARRNTTEGMARTSEPKSTDYEADTSFDFHKLKIEKKYTQHQIYST